MNKAILCAAALALLASPLSARDRRDGDGRGYANPSAVIAAEIGFAQLAQEKGQWTAFRATATRDAVMFEPGIVYAQDFLKSKADPKASVKWQPHQVWSSCDGSLAVTRGAWQMGEKSGWFTTIWQRQKDGKYKWLVDQGDELPMPLDAPEMIMAKVADCPKGARPNARFKETKGKLPALDSAHLAGQSMDASLAWDVTVSPEGARRFVVNLLIDGKQTTVQDLQVEAPPRK